MTRKLTGNVHVSDADGIGHVFGADDDVPGWAEKLITNKAAWDTDAADDETDTETGEPKRRPGRPARPQQ